VLSLSRLLFFFILMEAVSTGKHSRFHNGTQQKQVLAVCCSQFVVFAMSHSKNCLKYIEQSILAFHLFFMTKVVVYDYYVTHHRSE